MFNNFYNLLFLGSLFLRSFDLLKLKSSATKTNYFFFNFLIHCLFSTNYTLTITIVQTTSLFCEICGLRHSTSFFFRIAFLTLFSLESGRFVATQESPPFRLVILSVAWDSRTRTVIIVCSRAREWETHKHEIEAARAS